MNKRFVKPRAMLVYDGECAFCQRGSARLESLLGGRLARISSHAPGALELHPSLSREKTAARLYLVLDDGRLFGGAEAVARTLALAPWGKPALSYYLPGAAPLAEAIYGFVARHRYLLAGKCGDACEIPRR